MPTLFAWLIGLPVLRLKSDYLAIATLGFAEIIRAIFQWKVAGPVTNGSNLLKKFANFDSVVFPLHRLRHLHRHHRAAHQFHLRPGL